MRTITKNPINTIPPITESDLIKNAVIICMQNEGGDRWLYLAGNSINLPGTVCWIGGNITENAHIHDWHAGNYSFSLIDLILNIYKIYGDSYKPFIWIAESITEVESILNNFIQMNPLFRKGFLHECRYLEE